MTRGASSSTLIVGMTCLLLCQLIGEFAAQWSGLHLPGPVIGLLVFMAPLNLPWVRRQAADVSDGLLSHLGLLFVPVGVGAIAHLEKFASHGWRIGITLLISTWLSLTVSALVYRRFVYFPNKTQGEDQSDD